MILNALDLKNGKKNNPGYRSSVLSQPIHFLPKADKGEDWLIHAVNFYEYQGLVQIMRNANRLLKNYELAKGIINKSDYIVSEQNDYSEIVDQLEYEAPTPESMELNFFPLIPPIIDGLTAEFAERSSKISFELIDAISESERLDEKRKQIEDILLQQGYQRQAQRLEQLGFKQGSEEFNAEMTPEKVKSLPEFEDSFNKEYRSIYAEWAIHQTRYDTKKFYLKEKEIRAFRDSLITDREFWHFKMFEDDYDIEVLNPPQVFYHKSPSKRYISESDYAGFVDFMTPTDVINRFGSLLTDEQAQSLQTLLPVQGAMYTRHMQNDGSYYDTTRSHEWNTQGPSLAFRQLMAEMGLNPGSVGSDPVPSILAHGEDYRDRRLNYYVRVSTVYFKTVKKMYYLTRYVDGVLQPTMLVSEDYKVTVKPKYDTSVLKEKSEKTLIAGEHLEVIWVPEVWGCVKIGPNIPTSYLTNNNGGFSPIYIGVGQKKPGRLKFQFKGDSQVFDCKLPIEGAVFTELNTRSVAPIDKLKPYQLSYNIVNNQIKDILIDEEGKSIVIDTNTIPKSALGEDWGPSNFEKSYLVRKQHGYVLVDYSHRNTEGPTPFNQINTIDLSQTERLKSRIELSSYFKQAALEVLGLNPTRVGTPLSQEQTATGIRQAINSSYTLTEMLFIQHSDWLMPRVHQMRTDLAQWYHCNNPSVRLSYMLKNEQQINFSINGTELLGRDFNVYCSTDVNTRSILNKMQQLVMSNNTADPLLFKLFSGTIKAETVSEMESVINSVQSKIEERTRQEQEHQKQLAEQQSQTQQQIAQQKLQFEAEQKQLDRETEIQVAEIRSTALSATQDINQNNVSDWNDAMDRIEKQNQFRDNMNYQREKDVRDMNLQQQHLDIQRQKIQAENNRTKIQGKKK